MSVGKTLKRVLWTESPESKQERKLLAKIDAAILSYFCISFFVNFLDRQSLTNAYVTGMKEDLELKGNEYNVINTCLTVGYIIAQIPHALLLQKIPLRYYFPANQLLWGICTMCTASCKTFPQVCVARFFLGIFEASTFSGANYVMGSWYKWNEIGKRTGIFAASGIAGQMISGYVQTGLHSSLDGNMGRSGWQWMFLIDGIVTLPVAIVGIFVIPDIPAKCKIFYLNEEEIALARTRLPPMKPNTKLDWSLFKRVLLDWRFYVFSMLWVLGGALEAISNQGLMPLFLKYEKYSVSQVNQLPTVIQAVGILFTLIAAIYIDLLPRFKWAYGIMLSMLQLVAASVLLKWDVPFGAKLFAFYLSGTSFSGQPIYFSWANEVCYGDDPLRSVVLFSMNMFSSVLFCFWGILLYPADDAPRFHNGMITSICVAVCLALWCVLTLYCSKKDKTVVDHEAADKQLKAKGEIP